MSSNTAVIHRRRSSDPAEYLTFSWEICPPEILWMIFEKLSYKALLSCMIVSRRWKDIVIHFIECHCLWEKIVLEEMVNKGCTFRRKSILNFKEILINSKLWSLVKLAQIDLHHTYELQDITRMHVYKDNLILKTNNKVSYFDIKKNELRRSYASTSKESDYCENDYMVVIFGQNEESLTELRLYGKTDPNDTSLNKKYLYVMNSILLFRLEDNACYIITHKYIVWALIWHNDKWDLKLKGRYYGDAHDRICAMHVFNNRVSMVTKSGLILCEDPKAKKFDKVFSYRSRLGRNAATNWVLFNQSDVAMSVGLKNERIDVSYESDCDRLTIECADMTCATEHGEVLFIGYKDGAVAICLPNAMPYNQGKPQRWLYIQNFDKSIVEPAILALEVFEDRMSHHLLVAVQHKVLQLLITYPNSLL